MPKKRTAKNRAIFAIRQFSWRRVSVQHASSKSIFTGTGSNACSLLILALHSFENNYSHVSEIYKIGKLENMCAEKNDTKTKKRFEKHNFHEKSDFQN